MDILIQRMVRFLQTLIKDSFVYAGDMAWNCTYRNSRKNKHDRRDILLNSLLYLW